MQPSHDQVSDAECRFLETGGKEASPESQIEAESVDTLCTEPDAENASTALRFANGSLSTSPASYHLRPCTIEQYEQLDLPHSHIYDLVHGLLICRTTMPGDNDHERILEELAIILRILIHWVKVALQQTTLVTDDPEEEQQAARTGKGLRHPDIVLYRRTGCGRAGSSKIRFDKDTAVAVTEVTSRSTRDEGLTKKWVQYALTPIGLYVIIDRYKSKNVKGPFVIVGSLEPFKDAVRASNGYPTFSSEHSDQVEAVGSDETKIPMDSMYYKKVYKPGELIDCEFFKELNMTPAEITDPDNLSLVAGLLQEKLEKASKRAKKAAKRAKKAERRASDAEVREREVTRRLSDAELHIRYLEKRVSDAEHRETKTKRFFEDLKRKARADESLGRTEGKRGKKGASKHRAAKTLGLKLPSSKASASRVKKDGGATSSEQKVSSRSTKVEVGSSSKSRK